MAKTNWMNNPTVRKIDIRKLSVLMSLMNQADGMSFTEMMPLIIDANKHLTDMGLSFSDDEIRLIYDAMKNDLSDENMNQFNKLRSLMNLPSWN